MAQTKEQYLLEVSQCLISYCKEFMPIVIKIPRVYVPSDFIVKTDGKVVKVGNQFFNLTVPQQLHKLLHISMHVALRHHHRANEIFHNKTALQIWNLATDIVINNAVTSYINKKIQETQPLESEFTLVALNFLVELFPGFDLREYNAEKLFAKLLQVLDHPSFATSLMKMLEKQENEFNNGEFEDTLDILKQNGLDSEDKDSNSNAHDLIWGKRLEDVISKLAGTNEGTSLLKLLNDLPTVKVPWQKVLREFLTCRLLQERESNWRRPSRRNMAGVTEIFEPYSDKKKGIKKLVLCWDISGSCFSPEVISKFVANIEAVHKLTGCTLILMPFDTTVRADEIYTLNPRDNLSELIKSDKIVMNGGGGTDFNMPIYLANQQKPDVIVVLTDCYGPFPDKINIPTIWATTGDPAPWGKTLYIND